MSFRPPRTLPILTLFHSVKSQRSRAALLMLERKQKNKDGEELYRIDVMDEEKQPPTDTQLGQVAQFLQSGTGWKDMLKTEASERVDNIKDGFEAVKKEPRLLQCPIVVDWENGKAALGSKDLEAIERLINERK